MTEQVLNLSDLDNGAARLHATIEILTFPLTILGTFVPWNVYLYISRFHGPTLIHEILIASDLHVSPLQSGIFFSRVSEEIIFIFLHNVGDFGLYVVLRVLGGAYSHFQDLRENPKQKLAV